MFLIFVYLLLAALETSENFTIAEVRSFVGAWPAAAVPIITTPCCVNIHKVDTMLTTVLQF